MRDRARGRPATAFTLIELVLVLGLLAVFSTLATQGFLSWERSSALQQAVAETMALLKRATGQGRFEGRPYQIQYDPATRTLSGSSWQLDSTKVSSSFVDDRVVKIPGQVAVAEPGGAKTWIVDAGGGILADTGEVMPSQYLSLRYSVSVSGQERVRAVTLKSTGDLLVEVPGGATP